MRKNSRNKCYKDTYNLPNQVITQFKSLPESPGISVVTEITENRFDEFSGQNTVSIESYYEDEHDSPEKEKDSFVMTLRSEDAVELGLRILSCGLDAYRNKTCIEQRYMHCYDLLGMFLRKEINKITLYCKEVASLDPCKYGYGRYIIVVCGYNDNKCKTSFETITYHTYHMHPSKILKDIENSVKEQGLQDVVEVDQESFKVSIESLKKDNNLDTEKPLTEEDIRQAMEALEKRISQESNI